MDRDPNTVHVRSSFERPREPIVLVAAVAVFLALAILKPWSLGASSAGLPTGSAAARPSAPGEVTLGPSPSPRLRADPNGMACLSGDTEQVVLLERWAGNEVRSWIAAADRRAAGPLDPVLAQTTVTVYSSNVIGLGICAPLSMGGSVAAGARLHDVQVVRQGAHGPRTVDLGIPDSITGTSGSPDAAVLYGSPQVVVIEPSATERSPSPITLESDGPTPGSLGPGPVATPWPPGSYGIEFVFSADPSASVRWLRIDILDPAGTGQSAAPG